MSTAERTRLAESARRFRDRHSGDLLVLPNAWDAASARVLADAGYPAVATASAAVSASLGYPDGEGTPWQEMFAATARIARAVPLPVSMDAEAGYGLRPAELVGHLLDAGVVGCNLEDTDHRSGRLSDADVHAAWLADVRAAADASGVPLVINARVDVWFATSDVPAVDRLDEGVRRARLYRDAGADCVYPIGLADADDLAQLQEAVGGPVNANPSADLDLARLRRMGVARASYGPRFYRAALAEFDRAVRELAHA